jgi:hypothetical protein
MTSIFVLGATVKGRINAYLCNSSKCLSGGLQDSVH